MADPTPAFTMSVTRDVWLAVAKASSPAFADSYLYGAEPFNGVLEPRTVIAFEALSRDRHVTKALQDQGFVLKRPAPWSDGGNKRSAAECYGALSDAPMRRQSANTKRTRGDFA